jgi:hypothetical protein
MQQTLRPPWTKVNRTSNAPAAHVDDAVREPVRVRKELNAI